MRFHPKYLGEIRLPTWHPALTLMALLALPLFFCTCNKFSPRLEEHARTINLLDQIPDSLPAGPWRVVSNLEVKSSLIENPAHYGVRNLDVANERLMQTAELSSFRLDAAIRSGEDVFILLTYRHGSSLCPWVEAVMDQEGELRKDRVPHPAGCALMQLSARDSDAKQITIVHRGKRGQELPLESVIIIAADKEIHRHERSRLRQILSIRNRRFSEILRHALEFRRFPLKLDGSTIAGLVLTAGDSVLFNVPRDIGSHGLQFWTIPLEGDGRILVDAKFGSHGMRIGTIETVEKGHRRWRRWDVQLGDGQEYQKIMFSIHADDSSASVAICKPVIVAPTIARSDIDNLIIIDLDTMRADRLGCYGYQKHPTSAGLDSIMDAKGFYLFNRAYSTAPWTLPSTASFLTGRYLSNYPWKSTNIGIQRGCETLAEILQMEGFYCAAFTGGGQLRMNGFERGFHEFHYGSKGGKEESTFRPATKWLHSVHAESFFLFLHTYEPHTPYTRGTFCADLPRGRLGDLAKGEQLFPKKYDYDLPDMSREERFYVNAAYDGGVKAACDATADFFRVMDDLKLWQNTMVIILSDHGEELWDHLEKYAIHGHSLYGELLDVPFMIFAPGLSDPGLVRIEEPVSTIDMVPTIVDLFGMLIKDSFDGMSLVPILLGEKAERDYPALAMKWGQKYGRTPQFAVFSEGWKYVTDYPLEVDRERNGEGQIEKESTRSLESHLYLDGELYMLHNDPLELNNRAVEDREVAAEMRKTLDRALLLSGFAAELNKTRQFRPNHAQADSDLSPDLEAQLRILGYLD